jgi:hypothetical protein
MCTFGVRRQICNKWYAWQSGTNEHMQRYCPQIEGEWYLVSHLQRQGDYQKDTFDRGGSNFV